MRCLLYFLLFFTGSFISAQIDGHWHLDPTANHTPTLYGGSPPRLTLDVSGDSVAVFDALDSDLSAALVARHAREGAFWPADKIARTLDTKLQRIYLLSWGGTTIYPYVSYELTADDSLRIYRPRLSGESELLYVGYRQATSDSHTEDDRDALLYRGCNYEEDRLFMSGSSCTRYRYRDLREVGLPALDPPLVNKQLSPIYFDLVLGRLDTQRNLTDYPRTRKHNGYGVAVNHDFVIALPLDSLSRIGEGIEKAKRKFPESARARLSARIHVDRGTRMYWVYYLQEELRKAGQLKVEYVFYGGETGLLTRLPPYYTDPEDNGVTDPAKEDPEVYPQVWRTNRYRTQLGYNSAVPVESTYRRRRLYTARPDGGKDTTGTTIQVTTAGDFVLNGRNIGSRRDDLLAGLNALMDRRNPRTHIIYLSADALAYYRDFLHARVAINLAYERKYEEVAQREFGRSYADLFADGPLENYKERKKVRSEIPFVVVVE